jgi:hypothetical protein
LILKVPLVQVTIPVMVILFPTFTLQFPLNVPPFARSFSLDGHWARMEVCMPARKVSENITLIIVSKNAASDGVSFFIVGV